MSSGRVRLFENDLSRAESAASLLSRVLSLAALLLIAATWPLWTPQTVFPRSSLYWPLPRRAGLARGSGSGRRVVAGWSSRSSQEVRGGWAAGRWLPLPAPSCFSLWPISIDCSRGLTSFCRWLWSWPCFPLAEAIAWARLLTASIYIYSALSKLDWTFLESGGGQIVTGLLTFLHAGGQLSEFSQRVLAGTLAVGELLIAIGLCWRRSRRAAFVASLAMHALLLAA